MLRHPDEASPLSNIADHLSDNGGGLNLHEHILSLSARSEVSAFFAILPKLQRLEERLLSVGRGDMPAKFTDRCCDINSGIEL
jgi:hypothetical protein